MGIMQKARCDKLQVTKANVKWLITKLCSSYGHQYDFDASSFIRVMVL